MPNGKVISRPLTTMSAMYCSRKTSSPMRRRSWQNSRRKGLPALDIVRCSACVEAVPAAGHRQGLQEDGFDVVVIPELELGSTTIEELEPRRLVDGSPQTDDRLSRD